MIHHRSRTVLIARALRAAAPALHRRRGGRMPRQQQPDALRLEYYKAIRRLVVAPMIAAVRSEAGEVLRLLDDSNENKRDGWNCYGRRLDAKASEAAREREGATPGRRADAGEKERARALVDRAAQHAGTAVNDRELADVARKFGMRTSDFQKTQLDRQVRQATGVPLRAVERETVDRIPVFTSSNVELIKTVPDRYFESLRTVTAQAFEEGWTVDRLSEEIEFRGEVGESDARRIARDQIGKLNAQVNQDRQEALGVSGYIWRGAMDARERDEHRLREGKHFDWDDPPEDGHPGEPIQCRCYAEPDLSNIIEGLEE